MLMIHYLIECDKHVQSAAKEYRRVLHQTNQNWRPGAYRATHFNKEEAKRYVEHLEDSDSLLFVRAYKNYYIIMKVIHGGPIQYYSEVSK